MKHLNFTLNDDIAYVSFDRPESHNAINEALAGAFLSLLEEVDENTAIRAVVIGGAGAFCSGVDLAILGSVGKGRRWQDLGSLLSTLFHPIMRRIRGLSKPTIALIDGVAAGAGMSLALGCDFRVGTANARFVSAFSRLGLVPDCGGTWLLARMVGLARAIEIAALSKSIDALKAEELGLLTRRLDTQDFEADLDAFARQVAALPRLALLEMRDLIGDAPSITFGQALETELISMTMLGETADHAEGLNAFKERRNPRFLC